jgi:hypothetical protein
MAADRPEPPQTPVDPPPPSAGHWSTWVIVGGAILLVVIGYVLVTNLS